MLSDADFITFVPIKNMDRAIKFYTEALGGKLTMKGEGDMEDSWASLKIGKANFWLIVPSEKEVRKLAYSSFLVKDIKATVADLKAKGVKFGRAEKATPDTKIEGPISY